MYLIDTSVWITIINKFGLPKVIDYFKVTFDKPVIVTPWVRFELLRGVNKDTDYAELKSVLNQLEQTDKPDFFDKAANLEYNLKRKGLIIPSFDIFNAQSAILNGHILVHKDKHYESIVQTMPDCELRIIDSKLEI